MLNLYKLDIFVRVVDEGSFTAAAERLLMSQSGVSQHVQDLERSLGVALFDRGPRGVNLTPAGERLYDYARRILALVAEAEAAVTDVTQLASGRVTVGATPGVGVYVLAEWVQSFRARHPNLTVLMQTDITPRIVDGLLAQRLDLGIVEGELSAEAEAQLHAVTLEMVDQVVVIGRKHPFWARADITLSELNGQTFVMRQRESQTRIWLDAQLTAHGVVPRIGAEFDNVESIKRAVMASTSLTILPGYAVREENSVGLMRCLPITDHPLKRALKLIWDRRRHWSPTARSLVQHLTERFPALESAHPLR